MYAARKARFHPCNDVRAVPHLAGSASEAPRVLPAASPYDECGSQASLSFSKLPRLARNGGTRKPQNGIGRGRYLLAAAGASALLICWTAFHDPSASLRKTVTNRPFSVTAFLLAGSVAVST